MPEYDTIFFDADDTLLDFKASERSALQNVFDKHGITFDEKTNELYQRINNALWRRLEEGEITRQTILETRFPTLFNLLDIKLDGKAFNNEYIGILANENYIIDGALELCTELAKTHHLYCVTNGIGDVQRHRLKSVGLAPLFSGIFISDEIGYQKPMKQFFKLAFASIKDLQLSKSIIVGDSLTSDMRGGNAIGIDTCWYNPNGLKNTIDCKIKYEITNLSQILAIVG